MNIRGESIPHKFIDLRLGNTSTITITSDDSPLLSCLKEATYILDSIDSVVLFIERATEKFFVEHPNLLIAKDECYFDHYKKVATTCIDFMRLLLYIGEDCIKYLPSIEVQVEKGGKKKSWNKLVDR